MAPDLLNATTSPFYMTVRQLFSRLVFSLQIESSLSMEIISFWLWLEGNGHPGFLACIDSFNSYHFCAIALAGKRFIDALYLKSLDSIERSTQGSYFQKRAMEGVVFYLDNFCYKALEDILEITEAKEYMYRTNHAHEEKRMKNEVPMSTKDLLSKIKASYTDNQNHEEGTSSRITQSPKNCILEITRDAAVDERRSAYSLMTSLGALALREDPVDAIQVQQQSTVPRDERTLFVTFSNGYPFTEEELLDFFMGNFGDVEDITIEEPIESRPPLYGHVVFFSQMTLFRVLGENKRVKFVIRGKHLWARQYVPKRKKGRD